MDKVLIEFAYLMDYESFPHSKWNNVYKKNSICNYFTCCLSVFNVPKKNSNKLCTCCIKFQSTATVKRLISCSAAKTTLKFEKWYWN